ncbi:MAG: SAM-dependent methyltransferase, partial [Cyanobacteria bacterium J06600_6]
GSKIGVKITSVDPLYQFSGAEIKQRFNEVVDLIIDQIIASPDNWVWQYYRDPQELKVGRIKTMKTFLSDYDLGKQMGRYQSQKLPSLSFADGAFDLALCSHFLFLYSAQCSQEFHFAAIKEMLRVSREVRIFPLLTLEQKVSPYLGFIQAELSNLNYLTEICTVPYELQPGGNQMLVIKQR